MKYSNLDSRFNGKFTIPTERRKFLQELESQVRRGQSRLVRKKTKANKVKKK